MTNIQLYRPEEFIGLKHHDKLLKDQPDICLIGENSHCSLWWKTPPSSEDQLGIIGHFFAANVHDTKKLLEKACSYLRNKGCNVIVGPMDGNTWKAYRFVSWSNGTPPFLMEPQNPQEWPEFWQESGFSPCYEYISTSVDNLTVSDPRLVEVRQRLSRRGITWRPVDISRFEDELRQVFRLALEAFSKNVLYTSLTENSFLELYLPYSEKIDSDYVLIAEDKEWNCCGFVFAIPDYLQLQRGEAIKRLVIKTLAVSPARQNGGLGAVLVEEIQKRALKNGLTSAVHALMFSENNSVNIGKNSKIIRRYTLYSKKI